MDAHETALHEQQATNVAQATVAVATSDTALVPRNENRTALFISSDPTNNLWLSWGGVAVSGSGVMLPKGSAPLALSLHNHGAAVFGPIRAILDTAGANITYLEVSFNCSCIRRY